MDDAILADSTPATRGFLAQVLRNLTVATRQNIAMRIEKAQQPISSRLSTLEVRVGALAMIAGGHGAPEARAAELQARLDKATVALESLERRASRHAQHLAELQTRLAALERRA